METSTKDEGLKGLLREIDEAEEKCESALKRLRKRRLELTGDEIVKFTVSTIHKDRHNTIIDKIMQVDKTQSFKQLKEKWKSSATADAFGWFGKVEASGPKEKLLSVMPKIAKIGGTITIDPETPITENIPAPNKWWDYELEIKLDIEREAEKANAEK